LRVDPLSDFEQGMTLFAAKPPAARSRLIGHNPMKSSGWKIIVPSLGIAVH
jgi:hypothetical protein